MTVAQCGDVVGAAHIVVIPLLGVLYGAFVGGPLAIFGERFGWRAADAAVYGMWRGLGAVIVLSVVLLTVWVPARCDRGALLFAGALVPGVNGAVVAAFFAERKAAGTSVPRNLSAAWAAGLVAAFAGLFALLLAR